LLSDLDARASGTWSCQADRLRLEGFVAADDLAGEVAPGFVRATAEVPMDRLSLGIVKAAVERIVVTSWASELPDDGGSGTWLRMFQAARSVAVPLLDARGQTCRVIAVALGPDCCLATDEVVHRLREAVPEH
jgi:hypothetical protein